MPIRWESAGEGAKLGVIVGELDVGTADALRDQAAELINEGFRLQFDLGGVTFLDSTAIGVLIGLQRRLDAEGRGPLALRNVPHRIKRILDITSLTEVFAIESVVS